jgi:hypothetical protein
MKFLAYLFIAALAVCSQSHAAALKSAYLDDTQNIHIVTGEGKDIKLTSGGHRNSVVLSPDGEVAAWLVVHRWTAPGDREPGSSELVIYRNGRARSIKCEPFIRQFWFTMKGRRVGIDCGGSHFAGREILYDSRTLKPVASFQQSEVPVNQRPSWSASSEHFESASDNLPQ